MKVLLRSWNCVLIGEDLLSTVFYRECTLAYFQTVLRHVTVLMALTFAAFFSKCDEKVARQGRNAAPWEAIWDSPTLITLIDDCLSSYVVLAVVECMDVLRCILCSVCCMWGGQTLVDFFFCFAFRSLWSYCFRYIYFCRHVKCNVTPLWHHKGK